MDGEHVNTTIGVIVLRVCITSRYAASMFLRCSCQDLVLIAERVREHAMQYTASRYTEHGLAPVGRISLSKLYTIRFESRSFQQWLYNDSGFLLTDVSLFREAIFR